MTGRPTATIGSTTASSPSGDGRCRSRSAMCFSSVICWARRRVRPSASHCWAPTIASRSTGARTGLVQARARSRPSLRRAPRSWRWVPDIACPPGLLDAFVAALEDDLNFPAAIAELFRIAKAARRAKTAADRGRLSGGFFATRAACWGLLQQDPAAWFGQPTGEDGDTARIQRMVEARLAARSARDYAHRGSDPCRAR